jgi:Protein of unknown function (DUF3768)
LNDRLRQHGIGGTTVVTPGVRALGPDAISAVLAAITGFSAFDADNDPYGEHDFGSVQVQRHAVFFKIDCYDRTLIGHSPDSADPAVTTRVLTIMLAEEY